MPHQPRFLPAARPGWTVALGPGPGSSTRTLESPGTIHLDLCKGTVLISQDPETRKQLGNGTFGRKTGAGVQLYLPHEQWQHLVVRYPTTSMGHVSPQTWLVLGEGSL